jgi:deazaflavin-dependent oxidoreductase (nitroreductase family)
MAVRRRLARFNRVVANPLIGRVAVVAPGLGVVCHRGRRSGREYRTPVMVFRDGERRVIALPYGADSDWVRNVLAAGGCDLLISGRRRRMAEPRISTDDSGIPAVVRRVLRLAHTTAFLTLEPYDGG